MKLYQEKRGSMCEAGASRISSCKADSHKMIGSTYAGHKEVNFDEKQYTARLYPMTSSGTKLPSSFQSVIRGCSFPLGGSGVARSSNLLSSHPLEVRPVIRARCYIRDSTEQPSQCEGKAAVTPPPSPCDKPEPLSELLGRVSKQPRSLSISVEQGAGSGSGLAGPKPVHTCPFEYRTNSRRSTITSNTTQVTSSDASDYVEQEAHSLQPLQALPGGTQVKMTRSDPTLEKNSHSQYITLNAKKSPGAQVGVRNNILPAHLSLDCNGNGEDVGDGTHGTAVIRNYDLLPSRQQGVVLHTPLPRLSSCAQSFTPGVYTPTPTVTGASFKLTEFSDVTSSSAALICRSQTHTPISPCLTTSLQIDQADPYAREGFSKSRTGGMQAASFGLNPATADTTLANCLNTATTQSRNISSVEVVYSKWPPEPSFPSSCAPNSALPPDQTLPTRCAAPRSSPCTPAILAGRGRTVTVGGVATADGNTSPSRLGDSTMYRARANQLRRNRSASDICLDTGRRSYGPYIRNDSVKCISNFASCILPIEQITPTNKFV